MITLILQLFVSSRIRKIGKNMTLILNANEKVYKFRDYTIYVGDDVKLKIDKRELKLSWIEKAYLKRKAR